MCVAPKILHCHTVILSTIKTLIRYVIMLYTIVGSWVHVLMTFIRMYVCMYVCSSMLYAYKALTANGANQCMYVPHTRHEYPVASCYHIKVQCQLWSRLPSILSTRSSVVQHSLSLLVVASISFLPIQSAMDTAGFMLGKQPSMLISPTNYSELDEGLHRVDPTHKDDVIKRREPRAKRSSAVSCSDDSGSESMVEVNTEGTGACVGIHVDSIGNVHSYGIMVGEFGDEMTLPVGGGATQQMEAFKDKTKEKVRTAG